MRALLAALVLAVLAGCAERGGMRMGGLNEALEGILSSPSGLSQSEIASGLREALRVGTGRAVADLGRQDAFWANPRIRIPLPQPLADAQDALRPVGMAGLLDDLERQLNRGAEQAMPVARDLFWQAISSLTFDDVIAIWRGPDDAATRYLERTTRSELAVRMRPIVQDALGEAGAIQLYDTLVQQAAGLPFLPDLRADLTGHVLDRSMDVLFAFLAQEETAIRENPAARTTELLRRVFGALT